MNLPTLNIHNFKIQTFSGIVQTGTILKTQNLTTMTNENFLKAVQIITASNSPKVSFNVPVTDNYSSTYKILIHKSNASLINELIAAGFSLSMNKKGLSVEKYC